MELPGVLIKNEFYLLGPSIIEDRAMSLLDFPQCSGHA
jgi:hypothetical protein|tara:strand:+ start:16555 stop:16668 length:114 start_codon:yes stop_codon:yes gene_type:complete